ncbi:TPA: hypothetical protein N0F65_009567 [Lagenidium giganteum]|uniref:Uncharacterized protein n=1 Tax=Lagenidium giganteum TaxID=4803 RepID=A0AAV2YQU9_9STRA|nr:TPA: hypothetical protein N0F65_009567 [Lagenidium giganteum]
MYKTDLAFILNPPASDAEQLATASLLWMMEAGNTTSSACSPVHKPAVIVEPSASPDKTIDRRMQMHSIMSMSSEDEKESSSSDQENATKPSICSSKDCGRAAVSRGRCVRHGTVAASFREQPHKSTPSSGKKQLDASRALLRLREKQTMTNPDQQGRCWDEQADDGCTKKSLTLPPPLEIEEDTHFGDEKSSLLSTNSIPVPSFMEESCAIWTMGWQVSLATFCRISLSTISTAFLGHLGSNELAASALAGIWTNGVQMLIFGFAISLCTLCGQAYGAKNYELVGVWLNLGLLFLTLFSIPVMISYFYVDHILSFVTSDQEVLKLANTFARWSVPTVWPQAVYCALRQYLQAQEIVTPATIISIVSVFVCVISNQVLIYGFGPIPAFGFIGSPLAQCVASFFQPTALIGYACWYKGYHKKTWTGFDIKECLHYDRVTRFLSLSLGMTLNLALDEWVYNAVSSVAGSLGPFNLAANSVMFNLWGLVFGVYWGFGLPTQVRRANFLGANAPEVAKNTLRVGFTLGAVAAFVSAVFVYVFRKSIIAFFTPDPLMEAIIEDTLPIFCIAVFMSGLHIMLAAAVEAMSLASTLVIITASGSWLVMLPTSYLLGIVLKGGLDGLWWGSVFGESTKFILMAFALCRIDLYEMARRAVEQSEGDVLDDVEMKEDVSLRSSLIGTNTPTMMAMSPVVTSLSTPKQVHHHAQQQRKQLELEEGKSKNPRSMSYGATN